MSLNKKSETRGKKVERKIIPKNYHFLIMMKREKSKENKRMKSAPMNVSKGYVCVSAQSSCSINHSIMLYDVPIP